MADEHDYSYPEDCQHPDCKLKRERKMDEEIRRWNNSHPSLPPKPTFSEYVDGAELK